MTAESKGDVCLAGRLTARSCHILHEVRREDRPRGMLHGWARPCRAARFSWGRSSTPQIVRFIGSGGRGASSKGATPLPGAGRDQDPPPRAPLETADRRDVLLRRGEDRRAAPASASGDEQQRQQGVAYLEMELPRRGHPGAKLGRRPQSPRSIGRWARSSPSPPRSPSPTPTGSFIATSSRGTSSSHATPAARSCRSWSTSGSRRCWRRAKGTRSPTRAR